MNVLSLFDGISCGQIALGRAGITVDKYYAAEIDKYATAVTQSNFPNTVQLGDVTKWKEWDIDWEDIDLLIGGNPCQSFSFAGKQLAFDDPRGQLFFIYVEILKHIRSLNPNVKFLLENVKMKQENLDVISEYLAVKPERINADLITPQSRDRYYWFNWEVGPIQKVDTDYRTILDEGSEGMRPATARKGDPRPVQLTGDRFLCLTATYYKGVRADGRPALATKAGIFDEMRDKGEVRMLTPEECERLMGAPVGWTRVASKTQRYKMLGNGWSVPVIEHLFRGLNQ